MSKNRSKHGIAVTGAWLPVTLDFLRSLACAELSPLGAKLMLDLFALLGPNATGNGDLSIAPKVMAIRGWTSRASLHAAILELLEHGLLVQTRQGSRLDCSLFAVTLYPLNCDLGKLDIQPGSYRVTDYMGKEVELAKPPTETNPSHWRRARKTQTVAPPRNEPSGKRSATEQTKATKTKK